MGFAQQVGGLTQDIDTIPRLALLTLVDDHTCALANYTNLQLEKRSLRGKCESCSVGWACSRVAAVCRESSCWKGGGRSIT